MSNNNLNDKSAMLAKIAEINAQEGFNPSVFVVDFTDLSTGETRKCLPVMARLSWFRLKYPEGKIALNVVQDGECYIATAKVYPSYKDGENEYLAEATTSRVQMEEKPLISAREWAQTAAIGIALRNAGFGLQFAIAGEDFHDVAPNEIGTQTVVTEKPTKTETAKNVPAPVELTPEEKYKQALAIECPIKKFAGRTLGDVLLLEPGFIYWLAEKGDGKYKEAAKTICEQAKNQAA